MCWDNLLFNHRGETGIPLHVWYVHGIYSPGFDRISSYAHRSHKLWTGQQKKAVPTRTSRLERDPFSVSRMAWAQNRFSPEMDNKISPVLSVKSCLYFLCVWIVGVLCSFVSRWKRHSCLWFWVPCRGTGWGYILIIFARAESRVTCLVFICRV